MIIIDYNDKRPIYEQVTRRLKALIVNGVLEPDSKLPSVRALAMELSINPNTIQRAYSELERDGFIYSVKGRGNFIKSDTDFLKKARDNTFADIRKLLSQAKDQGISRQEIISTLDFIYKEEMS